MRAGDFKNLILSSEQLYFLMILFPLLVFITMKRSWKCNDNFLINVNKNCVLSTSVPSNFVVDQSLSCVWLFVTPWTAAHQASLSFTISWSLLKLMSIKLVMLSNRLILCCPFPCPQSFPALVSFPVSQPRRTQISKSFETPQRFSCYHRLCISTAQGGSGCVI